MPTKEWFSLAGLVIITKNLYNENKSILIKISTIKLKKSLNDQLISPTLSWKIINIENMPLFLLGRIAGRFLY